MKKHSTSLFFILVFNIFSSQAFSEDNIVQATQNLISQQRQLTFVGTRSGEGYFSADGKKMIYQSERHDGNPFYQMYILDLITGKNTLISTGSGMTTCGWIHPSLKKAMWSSTHLDKSFKDKVKSELEERAKPVKRRYSWNYDEQYDIFESDLNGKNVKRLTKELGYDAEGSYSPDGKYIAFASNRSMYTDKLTEAEKKTVSQDSSYAMEIYIMNSDGSNVRRLTRTPGYDGGPFFDSTGTKITWRRFTPDGSKAEIFTMNIDGTEQTKITQLNALSWAPFFHPSGEYIIFASSVLGYTNFELYIVDARGAGKPIRVTYQDDFDGLATFSPDGQKISWTHRNSKGESQIYIADWDHQKALELIKKQRPAILSRQLNLSSEISEQDTRQIIDYLASDDLQGRLTGSESEKIYTDEIAKVFKKMGLKPAVGNNFIQTFEFTSSVSATEKNTVDLKGRYTQQLKRGTDYQVLSYSKSGQFPAAPMVFAGFGIKAPATDKLAEFNSYKDLDVAGKWVVVLDNLPNTLDKEIYQHLVSYSRQQHKITVAKNHQAAGIIFISDVGLKEVKFEGSLSDSTLPVIKMSSETLDQLLEKTETQYKSFKKLETEFKSAPASTGFLIGSQYISATIDLIYNKSVGRNIIGVLEPKNFSKKTKGLLIGAHGDHLGKGENLGSSLARGDEKNQIHYGADDNASGVAGVLELAGYYSQELQKSKLAKPLYFAIWSGEEIGVLGSNHFTKSWKLLTGKNINQSFEAGLNMDMIGRLRDKLQVQGTGSAKEWAGLSEEVSLVSGLNLVLTSDPFLPTDSVSFYLAEIPSISFFTGTHEQYHSPRDKADLINHAGLVKTIGVVRSFIDKLATVKTEVVKYVKVESASKNMEGRSFRIYLGTIPDYAQEGVKGVKISGTSKNSPADKAGLKGGDIITGFGKMNIENLYDYVYALQSAQPNQPVKINVLREGQNLQLELVPQLKE